MIKKVCDTCNKAMENNTDTMKHYNKTGHRGYTNKWVNYDGTIEEPKESY